MAAKDILKTAGPYGAGVLSNSSNFTFGIKKQDNGQNFAEVIEKSSVVIEREVVKLSENILSLFSPSIKPSVGEKVTDLSSKLSSFSDTSNKVGGSALDVAKYFLLIPLLLNDKVKEFITGFFSSFLEGLGAPKRLIEGLGFLLKNLNYIIATYFGYKLFKSVAGAFDSVVGLLREFGILGSQLDVTAAELQTQKSVLNDKETFERGIDKEGKKVKTGLDTTKGELKQNKKKNFFQRLKLLGGKIAPRLVEIVKNFLKAIPGVGTVVGIGLIAYELFSIGKDIYDFAVGADEEEAKAKSKAPAASLLDSKINLENTNQAKTSDREKSAIVPETSRDQGPTGLNEYDSDYFKMAPGETKERFRERMMQYAVSKGYSPGVVSGNKSNDILTTSNVASTSQAKPSVSMSGTPKNISLKEMPTPNAVAPAGLMSTAPGMVAASPSDSDSSGSSIATVGTNMLINPEASKTLSLSTQSANYSINEILDQPAGLNIINIDNSKNILVASNG